MRGKVFLFLVPGGTVGITPACAGKSNLFVLNDLHEKDHPRVCGEKMLNGTLDSLMVGSPPRVRGKGQAACEIVVELGITPAYAGKRSDPNRQMRRRWDHPRVCGEKRRS